jgi:hypothetical protein
MLVIIANLRLKYCKTVLIWCFFPAEVFLDNICSNGAMDYRCL